MQIVVWFVTEIVFAMLYYPVRNSSGWVVAAYSVLLWGGVIVLCLLVRWLIPVDPFH